MKAGDGLRVALRSGNVPTSPGCLWQLGNAFDTAVFGDCVEAYRGGEERGAKGSVRVLKNENCVWRRLFRMGLSFPTKRKKEKEKNHFALSSTSQKPHRKSQGTILTNKTERSDWRGRNKGRNNPSHTLSSRGARSFQRETEQPSGWDTEHQQHDKTPQMSGVQHPAAFLLENPLKVGYVCDEMTTPSCPSSILSSCSSYHSSCPSSSILPPHPTPPSYFIDARRYPEGLYTHCLYHLITRVRENAKPGS